MGTGESFGRNTGSFFGRNGGIAARRDEESQQSRDGRRIFSALVGELGRMTGN